MKVDPSNTDPRHLFFSEEIDFTDSNSCVINFFARSPRFILQVPELCPFQTLFMVVGLFQ